MTRSYRQARKVRIDGIWIGLALMVASAVLVVGVLWLALSLLASMGTYIETVIP